MSALSPSKCKACSGKHVAHVCSRSTKYRQDNGEYAGKRLANKRRMNSVGHDVDNIDQKGIKRPRKACMYPRDNGRGSRRTFLKLANSSKKTPKDTVADLRSELLSRTVVYNPETKMHCREWDTTDVVKGVISALQKNGTLTSSQVASIIGAPEGHVQVVLDILVTTPLASEVLVGTREQVKKYTENLSRREIRRRFKMLVKGNPGSLAALDDRKSKKNESKGKVIESNVEQVESKVEQVESKVEQVESNVEQVESKVEQVESKEKEIQNLVIIESIDKKSSSVTSNTCNTSDTNEKTTTLTSKPNESDVNEKAVQECSHPNSQKLENENVVVKTNISPTKVTDLEKKEDDIGHTSSVPPSSIHNKQHNTITASTASPSKTTTPLVAPPATTQSTSQTTSQTASLQEIPATTTTTTMKILTKNFTQDIKPTVTQDGLTVTYIYRDGNPLPSSIPLGNIADAIRLERLLVLRSSSRIKMYKAEMKKPVKERKVQDLLKRYIKSHKELNRNDFYSAIAETLLSEE